MPHGCFILHTEGARYKTSILHIIFLIIYMHDLEQREVHSARSHLFNSVIDNKAQQLSLAWQ